MAPQKQKSTKTEETKPAKKAQETSPNAKTPKPVGPKDAADTKEWKLKWLAIATEADTKAMPTNSAEVCDKSKTTMAQYLEGRVNDPKFDAECLIFDQVVELMIIDKIRKEAAEGDARAQGLYFKAVRRPAFGPGFASWNAPPPLPPASTPLPAEVAGAMIEAGLAAFERLQRPDPSKETDSEEGTPKCPSPIVKPSKR